MAYIIETKAGTFAVVNWVDGKQFKKTFKTKREADRYKAYLELTPDQKKRRLTVGDLFNHYLKVVTYKKRGYREEEIRIKRFLRESFARKNLFDITRKDIQNYFDARSEETSKVTGRNISPGTMCRERDTLSAIFKWAVRHDFMTDSPVTGVVLPKPPEHRERVATKDDIDKLLVASGWDGASPPENESQLVIAAFLFGCYTGMRSGEILRLSEEWIDGVVVTLPAEVTKTATRRRVALGEEAMRILNLVREANPKALFYMRDNVRDALFRKIRDRAGIAERRDANGYLIEEGLHFHDSRATFCTWAASPDPKTGAPRLDVMALSRQTGHKDLKMLMRYYRETPENIAQRLK